MDFVDAVKQFAQKMSSIKDSIQTEEATKTAMIMPFFQQILGYDVFNPNEFIPEFTADYASKKGERVDYAVNVEGELSFLVEAKTCGEVLDKHGAQLFRYFNTTKAKFGILTNGIIYKFFTDLEKDNIMDDTPFFEFDFENYKEKDVNELKKFCKNKFNADDIASTASHLKYIGLIKELFARLNDNPDERFVKFVMGEVYEGAKTQGAVERFQPLVKTAFNDYINDVMSDKLSSALKGNNISSEDNREMVPDESKKEDSGIVTTEDEMEAFYTVRTILNEIMPREDITCKDTRAYFGILYKDNTWKWICRFKFQKNDIIFILPDENKKEIRYHLSTLNDVNNYKEELRNVGHRYIE